MAHHQSRQGAEPDSPELDGGRAGAVRPIPDRAAAWVLPPSPAATAPGAACAADAGSLHLSATILDFTLPTVDWPSQRIGRLDIDATVDTAKGGMSGTMKLFLAELDDDPIADAKLVEDAEGQFTGVRITAP